MNKKLSLFLLVLVVGITFFGCAKVNTTTTTTKGAISLPSGTTVGSAITSPECVPTGSVAVKTDGSVTMNLGSVIPTGSTESVAVDINKATVYVAKGDLSTSGIKALAASDWSLVSIGKYDASATPIDIVFILDNTGSMGGAITGAKNSIVAFATTLEANGIDAKFGLVTYGDSAIHPTPAGNVTAEGNHYDAAAERPILNFGTASALSTKLASVDADGGGDGPENPLDAVKWALTTNTTTGAFTNLTWRTGAQKVFVIITDINGHQSVEADTSSDNKCTTTGTLEIARIKDFGTKVYAVSPNYTTSQTPYIDVRKLADGFGEGRTTAEAATLSSGGKWIQFVSSGFDLTDLGISTTLVGGSVLKISDYSFENGVVYTIIVYYDSDGDGVADGYMYLVFTYSSTGSSSISSIGTSPINSKKTKVMQADDFKARPNN